MLASDPDIQVIGTARNGREGVELAKQHQPDAITLDIEMPEMDGLTALRHIMRDCPTAVLMLSSLTTEGSQAALTALRLGAADVLAKDMSQVSLTITNIQEDLIKRIKAIATGARRRKPTGTAAQAPTTPHSPAEIPVYHPSQFDVICIGSSTGGPPVLETILAALPETLSAPVIVAQHMPEVFTRSMAARLDDLCPLRVLHAADHMRLEPRTIYIAPGGRNIHLKKIGLARWEILVNDEPRNAIYRPNVSALFASAAQATGSRTLAVVLTGIGDDGLDGAREVHQKNGVILAQNEETCVVYGMPKAVTQAAIVQASLAPTDIARSLQSLARNHVQQSPLAQVG